jgi:threonine aldolase
VGKQLPVPSGGIKEIVMQRRIDLRSDTVTLPSVEMREAMYRAEVGDDYYFEDPTVIRLQEMAAQRLGKEAALFVTSGTMANCVSVFTLTQRGDVVFVEAEAHIMRAERGHLGAVSGVQVHRIAGHRGVIDPRDLEEALATYPEGTVFPRPRLLCIENTHNFAGGTCWSPSQIRAVKRVAERHGVKLYVDGARIFNAAIAQALPPNALAKDVDALSFCLSKGLACPFGSIIVGDESFIREARFARQMVGGGMRQAGIMAAAGIVALETMVERLAEDHANARLLAEQLLNLGCSIDMETVQSNMVFVSSAPKGLSMDVWVHILRRGGVIVNNPSRGKLRMVTHFGITRADILEVVRLTEEAVRAHRGAR